MRWPEEQVLWPWLKLTVVATGKRTGDRSSQITTRRPLNYPQLDEFPLTTTTPKHHPSHAATSVFQKDSQRALHTSTPFIIHRLSLLPPHLRPPGRDLASDACQPRETHPSRRSRPRLAHYLARWLWHLLVQLGEGHRLVQQRPALLWVSDLAGLPAKTRLSRANRPHSPSFKHAQLTPSLTRNDPVLGLIHEEPSVRCLHRPNSACDKGEQRAWYDLPLTYALSPADPLLRRCISSLFAI